MVDELPTTRLLPSSQRAGGMEVYFTTLGGEHRRFYGTLRQIPPTPTVLNNVVLYDALFDVANPDQVLMTQMTAQVFFVVAGAKDAVQVPIAALQRASQTQTTAGAGQRAADSGARTPVIDALALAANDAAQVSVLARDGKVTQRDVRIGVMNRVSAQIVSGLEAGEVVVIGTRAPAAAARATSGSALVPAARGGGAQQRAVPGHRPDGGARRLAARSGPGRRGAGSAHHRGGATVRPALPAQRHRRGAGCHAHRRDAGRRGGTAASAAPQRGLPDPQHGVHPRYRHRDPEHVHRAAGIGGGHLALYKALGGGWG